MRLIAPLFAASLVILASAADGSAQNTSPNGELPVVWVFSTGGTISGKGASSTSLAEYKAGALLGEELVAAVPEIKQVATVKVEQIANVSSTDITVAHWLTLANRINAIYASDPKVAGVVITHGTNTLEETAYFLNLTVKDERPVVLVGSMRPASAISADGPLNLLNAIRTAVARDARGKGTLVVLNDEINGAREVTKTNTYRVETFKSPELGLLGYVDADTVTFYRASTKRHTTRSEFDVRNLTALPQVDIVYSYVQPNPHNGADAGLQRCSRCGVRRHWRRPDLDRRARRAEAVALDGGGFAADSRALEPSGQRPRHRAGRVRRARLHPGGQPQSAEGQNPADAGADQDTRPRGDQENVS